MSNAKVWFFALLLSLTGAAWGADALPIPAGARIGVMDMMPTDVTHFHVGKTQVTSFMRTYRGDWSAADVIDEPLIWALTNAGYEPVSVQPSDTLRRQRQAWIVDKPQANKLPRDCIEELERVISAQNLSAIIIVAAGPNTSPESVEGNRLRKLPEYIQGWGFSTSDEPDGIAKPVVFNLSQMLLIQKTSDSAKLEYREWGGSYVYEWANFTPGADMKALPPAEIEKFKPVILDVVKRQIGRLMPHLKPGA
ncbi:MAG: hypothetical protein ABI885_01550 [Gammaproteobacteria bacterium]